jgi:2-polyprenyl-3-methyl-5-hydroxy-6-metoxy-1,4-benzoquinol methylase
MARSARFDWNEMRRYWEQHHALRARTDLGVDPHALGNVCSPAAPPWLNEHFARGQEAVFDTLLGELAPGPGRALDVGCGGARWTERLLGLGWSVDGIDLQPVLIEHNRLRLPQARFDCVALQDYEPDVLYSLVCSVTVLGHIPHDEQARALDRIAHITTGDAHVVMLENIRHQSPHVFANSMAGWIERFAAAGFTIRATRKYDFNPLIRSEWGARSALASMAKRDAGADPTSPNDYMARSADRASDSAARRIYGAVERAAGSVDAVLEPLLTRRAASWPPPVHAGILFVKAK